MKARPFPVTVLAILSAIAAVFAAVHALQALGILPLFFGRFNVNANLLTPNWWYFLMWALMVWVWVWLFQMLWNVEPAAWLFLAVISTFNLILDTFAVLFGGLGTTFSDYSLSFLVNGIILIYVLLPSTKRAFGLEKPQA
jgi:hypothetical protein